MSEHAKNDGKVVSLTGVTGQNGAYLTELLLEKGYTVRGFKRSSSSFNTNGIEQLCEDPHIEEPRFVGSGEDIMILQLTLVACVVGFSGTIIHDLAKPDGTPRKLMSADKLRSIGWFPKIKFETGGANAYDASLNGEYLERRQGDAA